MSQELIEVVDLTKDKDSYKMELDKEGCILGLITQVGEITFRDTNGTYTVSVDIDGEFWRVVSVDLEGAAPLIPSAARALGKMLLKAADIAEREDAKVDKAQGITHTPAARTA